MNSFSLRISSLFLYLFLFEPLQYFIIEITPSIYLGRLISLLIVGALIYNNKSFLLIKSFFKSLSTLPFLPYTLWTVGGGLIALIYYKETFYKIRFGIIEPLIYLLLITIFIILPNSFLREKVLLKIPKALLYTFSIFLIFGFLDLIAYQFGFNLIHKSLFNTREIGNRFHSLANEPRDYVVACTYYLASLSIFFVSPLLGNSFKKYFKFYLTILIPIAIGSLFLTKSFTFISTASIFLFVTFMTMLVKLVISLRKYKLYKSSLVSILIGFTLLINLILFLNNSELLESIGLERITSYLESFSQLQIYISEGNTDFQEFLTGGIAPRLYSQASIIFPLLDFFSPSTTSDVFHQFMGNGIGSVTLLLRTIDDSGYLLNSYSQFVRLLYEQGIIGCLFFLYIHFSIVTKSTFSIHSSKLQKSLFFCFSTLLLIAYLVHRRSEYFLFLGLNYLYLYEKK